MFSFGGITCMWGSDPLSRDSLIHQMGTIWQIAVARNASIQADSMNAIGIFLRTNVVGRRHDYCPIGAAVQIAFD